ncbi:hypothetical protein ACCO45_004725 [Purpureocillium lilacinum]|uniref:Uncharacterized protein n=1 Tax=Purpureocillium lilacinum TaxID=33203 RepID=A0ACC4DU13_PURLI
MTLILDLPPELILVVATHVVSKGDVNDLARSCRALYRILNEYLYNEDARSGVPTTLAWIFQTVVGKTSRLFEGTPVGCLMMEGAIRDVDARLVLLVAAERGHQRIAELLVEQGVDLNSSRGLCSVLQAATQGGNCGLAKFLAKHGARWREGDPYLEEVTCRAASMGDNAMLRLLLERGMHKSGDRILTRASIRRSGEMMDSFVENGAFGSTFAGWHYTTGQRECIRLKLMVWDAALRSIGSPNTANTVKLLREYAKDPAILDGGILRLAASLGNAVAENRGILPTLAELSLEAIRLLLERGADPSATLELRIWELVPRGNYQAVAELLLE